MAVVWPSSLVVRTLDLQSTLTGLGWTDARRIAAQRSCPYDYMALWKFD